MCHVIGSRALSLLNLKLYIAEDGVRDQNLKENFNFRLRIKEMRAPQGCDCRGLLLERVHLVLHFAKTYV